MFKLNFKLFNELLNNDLKLEFINDLIYLKKLTNILSSTFFSEKKEI